MATKLEKQIIQRMDGKTTFGKIGQEFGLSYQTIKAIATAHGIERPKSFSKAQRKEAKVIDLLKAGNPVRVVMKKTRLTDYMVNKIAKKHNVSITKINHNLKAERNKELIEAINTSGLTYREIGEKYNVSKARVQELAKKNGISRWKVSRERNKQLAVSIERDYKAGLTYEQMKEKYDLGKVDFKSLNIEPLATRFRKDRDAKIVAEYKTKTAKSVLKSNDPAMDNPDRLTAINSVYGVTSRNGFKKYPNVGNRNAGGVFENPKTIKLIKKLREKGELSFNEIATVLNSKGLKSPMGKEYTGHNLRFKYKAIVKHNA